ncbi:MAG: CxxxxCH/CxxCH domain-containing protein, partial [bacterium]|nr:CxxxxCH/CxxCH domain-containing protein [bacterium]
MWPNKGRFPAGTALVVTFAAVILLVFGVPLEAAHKLQESQCSDCHSVGGGRDSVVLYTRLLKKDLRVVEILSNPDNTWSPGQPIPCVYCHDADTVRTNMVGIKSHFSDLSFSKHPVNYLTSSTGSAEADLKCVDCHATSTTAYVTGGASPLDPNIHGVDTNSVSWTGGTGALDVSATYPSVGATMLDPSNTGGNTLCTQICHDAGQTGYASGKVAHAVTVPLVSLEYGSSFASQPAGCLDEGNLTGCHSPHNSTESTALITIDRNLAGDPVTPKDCGICHSFDDPPSDRASSDYYLAGHGKFQATVTCTDCHDPAKPHFNPNGSSSGNRLNFVEDTNLSQISDPPKSVLSNCVSSNCHAGKGAHSTDQVNVGCLDCHDPHGYGVGSNIAMVRRVPPVSAPATSLYFETAGAYYDSSTYALDGVYSNAICDNEDCHSVIGGPGNISNLMNTALGGPKHTGGTGILSGCEDCHIHDDAGGSFQASDVCDTCHGYPPLANYGGGPDGYAFAETRTYVASGHFKEEDKTPHAVHSAPIPNGYGKVCKTCHSRVTSSGYHNEGESASGTFRNVIFDLAVNPNALPEDLPSKRSPSYSITASTPNVCLNLYCHSDGQGTDRFNTDVVAAQAWTDSLAAGLDCEGCHGSFRSAALGTSYFGAPDYPTGSGGAGDNTYTAGSGTLASQTKANSHLDTTKHGRYTCSVCHYDTIQDTDASDGYTIGNRVLHVDGNIDVFFDGTTASGAYSESSKTCQVACHSLGYGSREAYSGSITYVTVVWGGTVACGDCHAIGTALTTGSHAVHLNTTAYPNGPGIPCNDCHTSDTDPEHADGKVDFNDSALKSTTTKCDACHGGATDAATAKASWLDPRYGDYTSGVTCESCHENDADGVAIIETIPAPDTATGFVDRGHGNILGLPWSWNAPGLVCVDCHDWQKNHVDGVTGSIGNLPRPLDSIDGVAIGSTSTSDVNTWCSACHDGSPGVGVITHNNTWVEPDGYYREGAFTLNCGDCHDPHSDPANIFMVLGNVSNTATSPDQPHSVVFLDVTGINS